MAADIAIFDTESIEDPATFSDPIRAAKGIDAVIVNGEITWRDGASTAQGKKTRVVRRLAQGFSNIRDGLLQKGKNMKTAVARLALGAMLVTFAGLSHAQGKGGGRGGLEDCREDNRNALKPIEANYAKSSSKLPKAEQDKYKSMLAGIKTGGSTLSDCRAKTPKIAELKTTLANMVAVANAPKPVKVGDNARGGIAFHVTNGGMNGLVAHAEDIPVMGGVMHFEAARQGCEQFAVNNFSDWYLPNSEELAQLWGQRDKVRSFGAQGNGAYWSSSRMQGQDHKLYWRRWSDGLTGWSDIYVDGPNRSLHNARCIRKF